MYSKISISGMNLGALFMVCVCVLVHIHVILNLGSVCKGNTAFVFQVYLVLFNSNEFPVSGIFCKCRDFAFLCSCIELH